MQGQRKKITEFKIYLLPRYFKRSSYKAEHSAKKTSSFFILHKEHNFEVLITQRLLK